MFVICWSGITVQHRVISQCWSAFSKQRHVAALTLQTAAGGQGLCQWIVTWGLLLTLPLRLPEPLMQVVRAAVPSAQSGGQSTTEVSEDTVLQFWLQLCHITRLLAPAARLSYSTGFSLTHAIASWFDFGQAIQVKMPHFKKQCRRSQRGWVSYATRGRGTTSRNAPSAD